MKDAREGNFMSRRVDGAGAGDEGSPRRKLNMGIRVDGTGAGGEGRPRRKGKYTGILEQHVSCRGRC